MFAVIKTGGKQYKVKKGLVFDVEKLAVEAGKEMKFEEVLLIEKDDKIEVGQPFVKKAKVVVKVLDHVKDKKVNIIKFKRRKHHLKRQGHRQQYTRVEVLDIVA